MQHARIWAAYFLVALTLLEQVAPLTSTAFAISSWDPTLLVNTEAFQVIDDQDSGSNVVLKFGGNLNKTLTYNRTAGRFQFDDKLYVSGSGSFVGTMSGKALYVTGTGSTPNLMTKQTTGRVGVGTANPSYGLEVVNSLGMAVRGASNERAFQMFPYDGGGALRLYRSDDATNYVGINPNSGKIDTSASMNINAGSTALYLNVGEGGAGGNVIFGKRFSDDLVLPTTYQFFGGNVGVGTSAPGSRLSVSGSAIVGLGIGSAAADANVRLEVVGTISGTTVFATNALRSSGALTWEGAGSGAGLYLGGTFEGVGLTDCDADNQTLAWDATSKRFSCGDDDTGGAGGFGTGNVITIGDSRYVNVSGDTMTGALAIQNGNVHTATATPLLNVRGTISGTTLFATNALRSSGALTWEGQGSGAGLYVGGTFEGMGLTDCDADNQTLAWDATSKRFSCGDDDTTGTGLDQSAGDARYVNVAGDTMTGALTVQNGNTHTPTSTPLFNVRGTMSGRSVWISGTGATPLLMTNITRDRVGIKTSSPDTTLDVVGTISGATIHASTVLRSSGSLITESGANIDGTMYVAGNNGNVGIGTATPKTKLEVVGTISGSALTVTSLKNCGALKAATNGTIGCGAVFKSKAATENVTSSTTMQADNHLFWGSGSISSNDTWVFRMDLVVFSSSATPDLRFAIGAPSGSRCYWAITGTGLHATAGGGSSGICGAGATGMSNIKASTRTPTVIYGTILFGSVGATSSGNLLWAQNISNATASSVMSGSTLMAFKTVGSDIAEVYPSRDPLIVPGTVVSIDPSLPKGVMRSSKAYDPNLMGVISTKPGFTIGGDDLDSTSGPAVFVALVGRVPVLVSTENGPIRPGDYLTSSSEPGVAMRATAPGPVIGQALTTWDGEGVGVVTVFIKNTFQPGEQAKTIDLQKKVMTLEERIQQLENFLRGLLPGGGRSQADAEKPARSPAPRPSDFGSSLSILRDRMREEPFRLE